MSVDNFGDNRRQQQAQARKSVHHDG
jgi:hypothetical protein